MRGGYLNFRGRRVQIKQSPCVRFGGARCMLTVLRFLLCDSPQRVDLAVSVERVVAQAALAHLRRAIVHRWEERID